ncbi:MAG: hypothetical protein IJG56_04975, partial [Clostridia bacterium]|nr:hypothetical protein [Clostridia bacterium]
IVLCGIPILIGAFKGVIFEHDIKADLLVSLVLYRLYYLGTEVPVWVPMLEVGAGQMVACFGLGLPLLHILEKQFPQLGEREEEIQKRG